ncbi:MAG: CDP-diacylglycerol--glycerol-3-phosphate 3-phosphatidyltransferase [Bacillota bacterium]|nr:CDP-diacylglycerol--glycerol-3-phosphate 3-phosphatidyltransferase [Bacillota bacterium]
MNIPNVITLIRLFLIPLFVLIFFSNKSGSFQSAIMIFFIAGLTDVVDGYLARKYNLITKWGTVMDPLADKLMLITVLTCFLIKGYIPLWIFFIMLIKEATMIIGGIVLYKRNTVIPADVFGKTATLLFYFAILCLLFNRSIGIVLIYIAVTSAVAAYINYFLVYYKGKSNEKNVT